jgi:hypothetical protein
LIPLALKGIKFRPLGAAAILRRNLLIYGVGGVCAHLSAKFDNLPNPAVIAKPGKVAGMIWIMKSFQVLVESALIADTDTC